MTVSRELTKKEEMVLILIAKGRSDRDIATEMAISINTVKNYGYSIRNKLGMDDRVSMAMHAVRVGLIIP